MMKNCWAIVDIVDQLLGVGIRNFGLRELGGNNLRKL